MRIKGQARSYLADTIVQPEKLAFPGIAFGMRRKFYALVPNRDFEDMLAIDAVPRIRFFFPEKRLAAVEAC